MRYKLDVPYMLGDDYFIDSKLDLPFYQVPLYRNIEVSFAKEPELSLDQTVIVGIFRKTGRTPDGIFTYKLVKEKSKLIYRPNCRGNE